MRDGRNVLFPRSAVPADVGSRIRQARLDYGLSQDGVAILSKLRRETIARIEAGGVPSSQSIFAIERALGLPSPHFVPDWKDASEPDAPSFGPRVRERRRELGISLRKLADAAGVSEATMSRFERELVGCAVIVEEGVDGDGDFYARITNAGIADELGFADVVALQVYCGARRS